MSAVPHRRHINLLKGYPHPSLLPSAAIAAAAATALSNPAISTPALLYGADEGYLPLRHAIAAWNTSFYSRDISHENIVITGGASANLANTLQVLTDPVYTRAVWICSPAYMLVFRSFVDNGLGDRMHAVPEVEDGIDVEALAREMEKLDEESELRDREWESNKPLKPSRAYAKHYRHVIYTVPTFSNPSSSVMSLAKREALVRLARQHDALIIADDVYEHLAWSTSATATATSTTSTPISRAIHPRLADVDALLDGGVDRSGADGFGNALSNASFSKIAGPGARCGWAESAGPKLAYAVSQAGGTHSGGAPSQLVSAFMCELLTSGWLKTHIEEELQPTYARRWRSMRDALQQHVVTLGGSVVEPGDYMGGFFVWVRLPVGLSGDEVVATAQAQHDLTLISGSKFEVPGETSLRHDDHVRLCFTWEDEGVLEEGVRRMAAVIKSLQK